MGAEVPFTMKQGAGKDNVDCLACVCCMITGKSLEYFKHWHNINIGDSRPDGYNDYDAQKFLIMHGYQLGVGFNGEDVKNEKSIMACSMQPCNRAAYLTVKSERFYWAQHAIYWDGKKVHDPNPETEDGRPLSSYKIKAWFPVMKMMDEYDEYAVSEKEMDDEVSKKGGGR